jgi:hypothetical protein
MSIASRFQLRSVVDVVVVVADVADVTRYFERLSEFANSNSLDFRRSSSFFRRPELP